jgi:TetR/AcrR family transcriptional regulator, ethionamide resistance regulator
MGEGSTARRRRRSPAEAEREILDAAERFLRTRPLRELTIDEVMADTSLSRPAFYVYFKDRHELVLRLIQELGAELFEMSDRWLKSDPNDDPRAALREALDGVVDAYARHGAVLRAIADASADDPTVEAAYRGLVERFIQATADHIRTETRAGVIQGLNAKRTASALVWMNERYLSTCLGAARQVRPREVAETLYSVWLRTLYLENET